MPRALYPCHVSTYPNVWSWIWSRGKVFLEIATFLPEVAWVGCSMSTNQQPPSTVPSWPSLYDPGIEILHIEHHAPIQPEGAYLFRAKGGVTQYLCWTSLIKKPPSQKDVFRFTLYWTLIFYIPIFLLCGSYAFWNYAFPPSPHPPSPPKSRDSAYQLSTMTPISAVPLIQLPKPNERRSRVTFALIVLMTFLILSVAGAVTGSAVLGFITAGLFKAANFNMSTCVIHFTC